MMRRERELRRIAKRFNRVLDRTRNGHFKLVDPTGRTPAIITPSTPSCPFSLKNLLGALRSAAR